AGARGANRAARKANEYSGLTSPAQPLASARGSYLIISASTAPTRVQANDPCVRSACALFDVGRETRLHPKRESAHRQFCEFRPVRRRARAARALLHAYEPRDRRTLCGRRAREVEAGRCGTARLVATAPRQR